MIWRLISSGQGDSRLWVRNPAVKDVLSKRFMGTVAPENIRFEHPLSYQHFASKMAIAKLIITDSGGIQEEATWLGVPFIVARDTTERPEAIDVKAGVLAGRGEETIYRLSNELLNGTYSWYDSDHLRNIYGDGHAAAELVPHMESWGLL